MAIAGGRDRGNDDGMVARGWGDGDGVCEKHARRGFSEKAFEREERADTEE